MRMGWSSLYTLTKLAYKTHSPEWAITHSHTHLRLHQYTHTQEKWQIHFYSCVTCVKSSSLFIELSLPLTLHKGNLT